jgi:hypothetical protein
MTYGLYRCPFCSNDGLVDTDDSGHKHDGFCGDREWADEIPSLPAVLTHPVCDFRDGLPRGLVAGLSEDATYADLLFALIDVRPDLGRKLLETALHDENDWYPTCPCCGRRAELIEPLVPVAG